MTMLPLVLGAAVFCVLSILLVRRWIPTRYSVPIFLFKFGLPLFYFHYSGRLFREFNKIAVDEFYIQTNQILSEGHTAYSLLAQGFQPISSIMDTTDPFYWWWNAVWIEIFGNAVFSPVLANVFVTVLASIVATKLLIELDHEYRFQQYFLAFSLLHWEILTWSSMMNIKDVLVMFLTISSMYFVITALKSQDTQSLLFRLSALAVALWILTYIRWYVPGLFLGAIGLWLCIEMLRSEPRPSLPQAALFLTVTACIGLWVFSRFDFSSRIDIGWAILGFFRYTIGPVPFGTADSYTFLNMAAVFHWILFPVLIIGVFKLVTKKYERLLLLYVVVTVGLYSIVPSGSGPRFRLQLGMFIALLQFMGLWFVFTHKYRVNIVSDKYITATSD